MTIRTLASAAKDVRALNGRVTYLQSELNAARATVTTLEGELLRAEEALDLAQATLNRIAAHGEESAA